MNRVDLIKEILSCYENPSYLEIGYGSGCCFDTITIKDKTCIDPIFNGNFGKGLGVWISSYSDSFFNQNTKKFDVIFIDGDHRYEQVVKDFENSKKFLNKNGCIVLHDCNPPDKNHTSATLCGDGGYRMFAEFYEQDTNFIWSTSFEDFGTCVVRCGNRRGVRAETSFDGSYEMFEINKDKILNLIPISLLVENTKKLIKNV